MILNFEAEAVEVEENDLGVLVVGFYTEENYLMIQQSLDINDAVYHIERDDQSYGGYGGVEKIELSRSKIEVQLDETGKETLDCDSINVDFETDDETYELLSEKLKLIFGNSLTVN
ncbi:MAG TPA: Imm10 family immunity protein [Pyrinomonadaceae bacterium]|nr:Imm10 family immunity protein [Pyrinomonadaceae bacterium]